jgi:membrane protein implicated in regulation of membrane protease activity
VNAFVVIGIVGVVIVLATLLFGDFLDGVFDSIDLGSGLLSAPVIGGFLAAFGFGAALATSSLGPALAAGVGVGAGVVVGGATAVFTRSLMRMPTDPTPRATDLVGRPGVVVAPVPAAGFGRVRVAAHGQQLQLSARADQPLAAGTAVVVVEVTSPTAVFVTPTGL